MLKHYLTTALRHFRQHKLTTSINVVCLTIGLVCFLASYGMVTYLSSGDKHFPNVDRTYMIRWKINSSPSAAVGPALTAQYLKADIPELKTIARATADTGIAMLSEASVTTGERKGFVHIAYADPEFLDVFALPFLSGDSKNALRSPHSAVISEDTAIRFFGSVPKSLGRRLRFPDGSEMTVRGVLDALKQPSHISTTTTSNDSPPGTVRFDVLMSMDMIESHPVYKPMLKAWTAPMFFTYVVLPQDGSFTVENLRQRLQGFGARHADTASDKYQFTASAVSDYWISMVGGLANGNKSSAAGALVFYFLGAAVLLISCLNYANLATAQGVTRAKEIGMRRVIGARRPQIIAQFMIEAALLTLAALLSALLLIAVAVLSLRSPAIASVATSTLATFSFWLTLVTVLLVVTIAAGIYPSFVLSSVRPLRAVRAAKSDSGRLMSRFLVAMQFAGASFLLIVMLVMHAQNQHLKQATFTNAADTLVSISNNTNVAGVDVDLLRSELLRLPRVQSVTAAGVSPWAIFAGQADVVRSLDTSAQKVQTFLSRVHHDFFSTMGISLLAGRVFDREHANDDSLRSADSSVADQTNVVIDRAFAEQQGWLDPSDALGKTFYAFDDADPTTPPLPRTVIGVVETRPLTIVSPLGATATMYLLAPARATSPIIRISTKDAGTTLREIESVWNRLAPSVALKMRFADDLLNDSYRFLTLVTTVFGGIATLAFVISILGLIGMSMHVIVRRQHEIGVRKTLGASVRGIVQLLLTDFSKPVIVANLLAWPIAFIAMQLYLKIFAQRMTLSLAPFIASLAITVLIAWIAVAGQATRAARLHPATVLRSE